MTTPSTSTPQPTLVNTVSGLEALARSLAGATHLAVDTESDGFFRYRPRLCLLQVAGPGVCALVDTLAVPDLGPLGALMASPDVECVFHDAEQDVAMLQKYCGVTLGRLFDSSHAARLLGHTQLGLAGVLAHYFGIQLDKKEQRSDWSRRPLSKEQLHYAAMDVFHLIELRHAMARDLEAAGRTVAHEQLANRTRTRFPVEKPPDMDAWKTQKGVRELDARGRGAYQAVWTWREETSIQRDSAPFRVLAPETLLTLAQALPKDVAQLASLRGVPAALLRGDAALSFVSLIQDAPPFTGQLLPPRPVETDEDRIQEARFDALRAWRTKTATAMKVDVSVIASNAALKSLARDVPKDMAQLAANPDFIPWQVETFGPGMLEVLAQPVTAQPARRNAPPRGHR